MEKREAKATGTASGKKGNGRAGVYTIILSQFGFAFSLNIVLSFMPFYILSISRYSTSKTMVWIGLIMGMNSFFMAAAAPFWGRLTSRFSSRMLYERVFLVTGFIVLMMGFTKSLPVMLALRIIQGTLGGASTIGLFMISRLSEKNKLAGNISLYQNSITAGQLLGPPVGAYIVVHAGYKAPFILSSCLIFIALIMCHLFTTDIGPREAQPEASPTGNRNVIYGWAISFIATIHLTFLPSILPSILSGFSLQGDAALKSAGFIMMGYTAAAIVGNYLISNLTPANRIKRTIVAVCLFSALLQAGLYLAPGVITFTVVRMVQTGAIAAVVSLVMAEFAGEGEGGKIGFLNSARFAGNGAGPMLATFILARSGLLSLYLVIALSTIGSVLAYLYQDRKAANRYS